MLTRDEVNRLSRLLNHLHLLTGVKFALMDENGKEAYTSSDRGPFCRLIAGEEEEGVRCGLPRLTQEAFLVCTV